MKSQAASSRHTRGLVGAAALSGLLHAAFLIWLTERLPMPSEDPGATELTVVLARSAPRQTAAAHPPALDAVQREQQAHEQARAQREPPAEAQSAPPPKSHPPSPPRTAAPAEAKPTPTPTPTPRDDAEAAAAPPPAASAAPRPTPPAERAIAPLAPPPRTAPVPNEAQLAHARARHHALREARTELARHFRYPPLAQRNGWEGTVVLGFRVSEDGAIEEIVIARTSGHGLLDRAARDALARVGRLHGFAGARGVGALDLELPVIYRLTES
ncbi:TonB family protein [Ectothiorhodospiraceae bacterium 2226]|nr:TonB family protein [Ectothiorhodospiraceae bacterium 2226]